MAESTIHIYDNDSEADTCRKDVLPKIYASYWTDEQILEQRTFTDGKIVVLGRKAKRKKAKRFDYLLRYSQNYPLAIVEAKVQYKSAADGMQQAKAYAQILGLKFAYSTNGKEILEFDFITGIEKIVSKLNKQGHLAEIEESFMNGRRVLAVFAEQKRTVKGILHGESDSRKTAFVEPEETIELNNQVSELENDERKEVYRILRELTGKLSAYSSLLSIYHTVVQLDQARLR